MLVLLILSFLFIFLLEAPRLLAAKKWKELVVFLLLWLLSSGFALAVFLDVPLPNPATYLYYMFKPFRFLLVE